MSCRRILRFTRVFILWRDRSLHQKLRDELRKTLFGLFTIGMPRRSSANADTDSQQNGYDAATGPGAGGIVERGGVVVRRRGLERRLAYRRKGFQRWRHPFKLRRLMLDPWRQVAKLRDDSLVRIGLRTRGLRSE
ncbi:hypothetical protein J2S34_003293 [Nitrobacter winogradskyi]|uniref:Uncharacterized protein n=2 Tax=Nitrobacter winogradskyi TaxID=913 RepID=A0ACC6ALV8_NITWI|nr:hypothetical protein [Nitrobacter winogradskyi]GEC17061.1 hypothetical protein NWI01_29530 [Nitrobacter winogradskyi]